MSWNFSSIGDYVNKSDEIRKAIIQKCHDVGYIIPTDEMRIESGQKPITITEIPPWLYKLNQAVMVITTTSISTIKFQTWLLDNIPDLRVKWDWDESEEVRVEDLELASDYADDNVITYTWKDAAGNPIVGNHVFALFSPARLQEVSKYAFLNNDMIKEIKLTPVITELANNSLFYTVNLEKLTFGPNIKKIYADAIYRNKITNIELPNSVEVIYGPDTFYCSELTSFVIPENSNLKELHNAWIFNFGDRPTDDKWESGEQWLNIPEKCKFYSYGNQVNYQNLGYILTTWNPFSRCSNRVNFKGKSSEDTLMNDKYGVVYLKDNNGDPIAILNIPWYDIFDEYTIPSTVKYISYGAFMSIKRSGNEITVNIPDTIQYIHPQFIYWNTANTKLTSSCSKYPTTDYGGLMTYSTDSTIGNPDVLLHEPRLTCDVYEFPENFSSLYDIKNQTINQSALINYHSQIQTIKINKVLPQFINQNWGPFIMNPIKKFEYLQPSLSCDNYTIEDEGNVLYMKENDNPYEVIIGTAKNISTFSINPKCKKLYLGVFNERNNLTGTLDLGNLVESIGYQQFSNMASVETIQFGNSLESLYGYMSFSGNHFKTLKIGTSEESNFKQLGHYQTYTTTLFNNNVNLTDIWIYGLNVEYVSSHVFTSRGSSEQNVDIHIHFYTDATKSTYTKTYNTFVNDAKFTTKDYYNKTKLVNIKWPGEPD